MNALRRMVLVIQDEAIQDLQELDADSRQQVRTELEYLNALPRSGEPKTKRLEGAWSWSFPPDTEEGRIIYCIQDRSVIVFAVHSDHDEAYRRARERASRYL